MKTKKQLSCMFYVVATTFATKVLWKEGDLNVGYDFESQQGLENILGKNVCKDVFLVSNFQKHGNFSLLWKWKNKKQLHIDLKQQLKKVSILRKACGIYFWIYQRKPIKGKLKVTLQNPSNETYHFDVNLHFKNWRAVARTFQVSEKKFLTGFDSLIFEVNIKSSAVHHGKIYFDLIRLSSRCIGWSYDTVNPPQIPLKLGLVNDIGGTENLNGFYEENHFWQSTYKWWKVDRNARSKIDAQTPLSSEEKQLIDELKVVEKSVDNWYYPTGKVVSSLDKYSQQKLKSLFQCSERNSTDRFLNIVKNYKKESYPSIRKKMFFTKNGQHDVCVRTAYEKYLELSTRQKHLFPSRDIFPYGRDDLLGMKFNEVNHHILFPLVLQFFISKRMREAEKIHSTTEDSRNVKEPTQEKYAPPFLFQNMEKLSTYTDRQRISLFTKTFRYLQTEGWDEGSSLGNTDHLLNLNEGYTQSIYLIRKELSGNKIFKGLLKAARWYNEIGEIHQMSFANKGTTADKGKNVLGRLLLILASPQKTIKEARQKILDAKRLKAWIENALEINEAYAGIIKPDFTGYHHKGVYMSVYSSEAIHALSIASYFLRGTSFAISEKYLSHLTEALKTLYLMSNSLAIPLGVSGAKLANSIVMHQLMPAFAYMSLAKSDFEVDKTMASIFLKLYDKSNPFVLYALEEGEADQSSRYFNSIGSVILMENLQRIAKLKNITSIKNPHGHWFFSFASLGLHRRKDWSVTVKGFSKFTWDFESLINQNVYGRFLSHGHLCITNGVSSLPDVFNGWDWNRIPGATTMEFELAELISHGESRYFTNKTSVGGSPFGEFQSEHGVFIMDFEQPKYESRFFRKNPNKFSFKKSFFFVDDIIVCLGSNIQQKGIKNRNVITTIFQEKLHLGGDIRLNGSNFSYPTDLVLNRSGYFLDGQSNGYVIPDTNKNPVHLKIDLNTKSRRRNGELVKNPDIYASLVFQHGKEPVNESYEYVIQVATNEKRIHALAESISHHYEVIQKGSIAHIVRFKQLSITAYAIFDALNFVGDTSSHVIYSVNRASIVTVFDKGMYYFISVMDPDLRRFEKYISNSKYMNQKTFYGSRSQPGWLVISLNVQLSYLSAKCPESLKKTITIYEDVTIFGNVKPHIKLQLSHGHTCEMKFKKRSL